MVPPSGNIQNRQIELSNRNAINNLPNLIFFKKLLKKVNLPKHKNGNMACIGVYGRLKIELMPMLIDSPMATENIPAAVK